MYEIVGKTSSWEFTNPSVFDIIVSSKRTNGFKWNAATLEGLKEYIRKNMKPPSLEKDGTVLKFINGDKERYSPQNDQDFCKMLRLFVSKNNFKLIVVIETLSKAFSDRSCVSYTDWRIG
ncbi:hypothetical protein RirG_172670 [Rhizophagus irregularis DAOM 197198w]|uniref:Uncharacterized protein n=1 Tax=Rhizophagus irregularis (strain DAOM 197198w) TaxID=1432141 RepID=A0A015KNC7_RHIIW|nr:hypothetical protein RirG_172670 [Rhizophagus irregularis DAOM 197198w]